MSQVAGDAAVEVAQQVRSGYPAVSQRSLPPQSPHASVVIALAGQQVTHASVGRKRAPYCRGLAANRRCRLYADGAEPDLAEQDADGRGAGVARAPNLRAPRSRRVDGAAGMRRVRGRSLPSIRLFLEPIFCRAFAGSLLAIAPPLWFFSERAVSSPALSGRRGSDQGGCRGGMLQMPL